MVDLLLPRHCVVCDAELGSAEDGLCNVCLRNIVPVQWESVTDNPLLRALWDRHDVEAAGSSFYYNASSDFHKVFIAIKYRGCPQVGQRLAALSFPIWHARGLAQGADYVIPVPLSPRRQWRRGYNQSEWVARGVSSSVGIPLCNNVLVRIRNNETQTHKSASQRRANTTGIFAVRKGAPDLNGRTILLVDDIMTTGSTVSDCIRALREAFPDVRVHIYTLGTASE